MDLKYSSTEGVVAFIDVVDHLLVVIWWLVICELCEVFEMSAICRLNLQSFGSHYIIRNIIISGFQDSA